MQEGTQSFSIPKSSLQDRLKIVRSGRGAELKRHTKELASCLILPLSRKKFLKVTHALAEEMCIPYIFNDEYKSAEKHFYQVMNRYPHVCL